MKSKESFDSLLKRFDQILAEETEVINKLQTRLAKLGEEKTKFNDILTEEVPQDVTLMEKLFREYKKKTAVIEVEIEVVKAMVKTSHYRRRARLGDFLNVLEEARNEKHRRICDEIMEGRNNLKAKRAEYLLACKDIYQSKAEGQAMEQSFLTAVHQTFQGSPAAPYKPSHKPSYPYVTPFNVYEGIEHALAPQEREVNEAISYGKLPFFVQAYEMTGELISEREGREIVERNQREVK